MNRTRIFCLFLVFWLTWKPFAQAAPGDLDPTFGTAGKVITAIGTAQDRSSRVVVQGDGRIVVAGSSDNQGRYDFAVARYNPDGTLDATFNGTGKATAAVGNFNDAHGLAVQKDGKIVIAGLSDGAFGVVRFNADGTLDSNFATGGKLRFDFGNVGTAFAVAVQDDGKIVVAGDVANSSYFSFAVARLNADGSLDSSFGSGGQVITDFGANSDSYSLALQSDGKIVVAGKTFNGSEVDDFAVVRYNADGTLDASFNGTGKVITSIGTSDDAGASVALQGDGKILVAGSSADANFINAFALVRYNANGSLDSTFNGTGKATLAFGSKDDRATSLALQTDGRVIIAGYTNNGYDPLLAVARFNPDGSLDRTLKGTGKLVFDGFTDFTNSIALQSDGMIVAAGGFYDLNQVSFDFALARFDGGAAVGQVLQGPVVNPTTGNTYYLLSPDTWTNSEARAQALGGHLATVNDAAENQWIFKTFTSNGKFVRSLWIGLNDLETEGNFVWTSGESVTFTNWNPGEPNNSGTGESFAHLIANSPLLPQGTPGRWNDLGDTNTDFVGAPICGVVEVSAPFVATNTNSGVPNEPQGTVFLDFGSPAIDRGNVGGVGLIQTADQKKQTVIFGTLAGSVLARTGGATPDGATFTGLGAPVFGGDAFGFTGKSQAGTSKSNALYSRQAVAIGLKRLAFEGGAAPGTNGGFFAKLIGFGLPRNRPGLIFTAKLRHSGGVANDNDFGIWRETPAGGLSELLLRHGSQVPIPGDNRKIKKLELMLPVPNASDQRRSFSPDGGLMAAATFDDGSNGILRVAPSGAVDVPLDTNSILPAALPLEPRSAERDSVSARIIKIAAPATRSGGGYAALITALTNTRAGTTQTIYASIDGSFRPVLRQGDPVPGNSGQRFQRIGHPLMGQSGLLGLIAALSGRGISPAAPATALVQHRGGKTTVIAKTGGTAQDCGPAAKYLRLLSVIVTDTAQGQIVFTGTITGPGVNASNNLCLWCAAASGQVKLLLRSNQQVDVDGTLPLPRVRSFQSLSAAPASKGQGRSTDADGFVTAKVSLNVGGKGVLRIRLP